MSNHRNHEPYKNSNNEHFLKNLPTGVLNKAKSTLLTLGGALRNKQDLKSQKQDLNEKKKPLKTSRFQEEFSNTTPNKRHSRIDNITSKEYSERKQRPQSVGNVKICDKEIEFPTEYLQRQGSPPLINKSDSSKDVYVQSRLVIPLIDRVLNQDEHDSSARPRKKLSFREPEIVGNASATLGRSHKIMGVNSLAKRPNKRPLRTEPYFSSLEGIDIDLESQAMRIVRTVGQAFDLCPKIQKNSSEQVVHPSTDIEEQAPTDCDSALSKEAASDSGASVSNADSICKVLRGQEKEDDVGEEDELQHLEIHHPPAEKNTKLSPKQTHAATVNQLEFPECSTKVEVSSADEEVTSPSSGTDQLLLLRERLEQQVQHTRAAVAQLLLLRNQVAAEQAARHETETRANELLAHNKELLEHIAALVAHLQALQENERGSCRSLSKQVTRVLQLDGAPDAMKAENYATCNENIPLIVKTNSYLDLNSHSINATQNVDNSSMRLSPMSASPIIPSTPFNGTSSAHCFENMTNEQIQNYLISKFHNFDGFHNNEISRVRDFSNNPQVYQNCKSFPNVPSLANHYSNTDLTNWMKNQAYLKRNGSSELLQTVQPMSIGNSENSLCSNSQNLKDSSPNGTTSDEGSLFIMPLSQKVMLTATEEDGRVRLIVPVSPSGSMMDVAAAQTAAPPASNGNLLTVTPAGPITRSASEKIPHRNELLTAMRSRWTRHTTK